MFFKKIILPGILFTAFAYNSAAQINSDKLTGAQILRTVRAIYDQGRLHELPVILEDALKKNTLSQSEKVEAYKILILTYIYLEEPQKADNAMIHLLRTDHFLEINNAVDPVEFQSLYKKFRTKPLFRIGAKAGLAQTYVNTIAVHHIPSESAGKGKYTPVTALQLAATFEKDWKEHFVINPEISYSTQAFNYVNNSPYYLDYDSSRRSFADHTIKQNRVQLNLLMQYKIAPASKFGRKFFPYVVAGPSLGYLVKSSFVGSTIDSRESISGTVNNTQRYNQLDAGVIGGAGIKFKIGGLYITGDIRFRYGFFNIVNKKQRMNTDTPDMRKLLWEFNYVDNDFSLNQAMVNVGFLYPFFSPKKLIK